MEQNLTLEELAARMGGDSTAPYFIAGVLREAIYRGVLPEGQAAAVFVKPVQEGGRNVFHLFCAPC